MYYIEVFDQLNKDGVRYLVVGGIALVLYGVVRLTADLDIFVDLEEENLVKFLGTLKKLGYVPKLPVDPLGLADLKIRKQWIKDKNMKVFSFIHAKDDYKLIDVFVDEPVVFSDAYKRRQIIKADNVGISVISSGDLIKLKEVSAREQDLADIEMLKELIRKHEK